MSNFKDALLIRAAVRIQQAKPEYQEFEQRRQEIKSIYDDFFINKGGIDELLKNIDEYFVEQLQNSYSVEGRYIVKTINWGSIVTMYHNNRKAPVDPAIVSVKMQDFCRSKAFDFVPQTVKDDAGLNTIEAYLVDPFNGDTHIGMRLIRTLMEKGYDYKLTDLGGHELHEHSQHPANLTVSMDFTKDDIKQLHRIAGRV